MRMTRKTLLLSILLMLCCSNFALAYDGWSSELSHVGGSAAMAGAATAIADHYGVKHRALVGFGFSTTVGLLGETIGTQFSWLDMVSNIAGASIGAITIDRYVLVPVAGTDDSSAHSGNYVGLLLSGKF